MSRCNETRITPKKQIKEGQELGISVGGGGGVSGDAGDPELGQFRLPRGNGTHRGAQFPNPLSSITWSDGGLTPHIRGEVKLHSPG